jgi:hypothetical protein
MSYLFYYNRLGTPGWVLVESFEKKTVLKCLLYFKKEENCLTQLFILLPEFEKNAEQLKPIL